MYIHVQVHSSGSILHFEILCPWKQHLFDIEKAKDLEEAIKFVLYSDQNGQYRVQVHNNMGSIVIFNVYHTLPEIFLPPFWP